MDLRDTSGEASEGDEYQSATGLADEVAKIRSCIKRSYTNVSDVHHRTLPRFYSLLSRTIGAESMADLRLYWREISRDLGLPWLASQLATAFPAIDVDGVTGHVLDARALVLSSCRAAMKQATTSLNRGEIDSGLYLPRMYYQPHMREAGAAWRKLLGQHKVDPGAKGVRVFASTPNTTLVGFMVGTKSVWHGLDKTMDAHCRLAKAAGMLAEATILRAELRKAA